MTSASLIASAFDALADSASPDGPPHRPQRPSPGESASPADPEVVIIAQDGAMGPVASVTAMVAQDKVAPVASVDLAAPLAIALEQGIYAGCAGIVLLHPFLPRFFEGSGSPGDRSCSPSARSRLLHFLATGQARSPNTISAPKLLCNVPPETPVESRDRAERGRGRRSGGAAGGGGPALGCLRRYVGLTACGHISGAAGQAFAAGRRRRAAGGARSYDILLDRLPWGIGLIQLPWMEKTLWVEWTVLRAAGARRRL